MTISLRPLAPADLAVAGTWFEDEEARRWLGGPDWPAKSLRLAGSHRHSLLALDDGVPIGLVDLELYPDGRASFAIALDPARRRRGLGTAVVAALVKHTTLAGVREIFAEVEEGNAASAGLLLRCGFVQVADLDHEGFRYYARPAPEGAWELPD